MKVTFTLASGKEELIGDIAVDLCTIRDNPFGQHLSGAEAGNSANATSGLIEVVPYYKARQ